MIRLPSFAHQLSKTGSVDSPATPRRRRPRFTGIRALVCGLTLALIGASCGKVGAPSPPTRITERTSDLSVIQRGSNIYLSWPSPALVQNEASKLYISRVDIYRLTERRDQEPVLDPDDYEDIAKVIGFLDRSAIETQVKALGHLEFADKVNLIGSRDLSNTRLRYAIRYVNKRGQLAMFSNTAAIEPGGAIAMPPTELRVTNEAQDAVALAWNPPSSNEDGVTPASLVGYNVYRRSARSEAGGTLLNSEPLDDINFTDRRFQYLEEYVYLVRSLSQGENGLIESADSVTLSFKPIDRFAPAAPEPLSLASANGTISLFWPSSSERDVVGYNVYRAGKADAPNEAWIKLNDQPITTVTFRDDRVAIDQTYSYSVTAVDRFANESPRSRVVSEIAHP